jgi:hypothetical protein
VKLIFKKDYEDATGLHIQKDSVAIFHPYKHKLIMTHFIFPRCYSSYTTRRNIKDFLYLKYASACCEKDSSGLREGDFVLIKKGATSRGYVYIFDGNKKITIVGRILALKNNGDFSVLIYNDTCFHVNFMYSFSGDQLEKVSLKTANTLLDKKLISALTSR